MPHNEDNPLPLYHDLCFDSRNFNKEHFSVDEFLQEHRNRANLETLRDDLGAYLQVLRSAMIDLINKDYADFVDLSSNLIGLDKGINRIQLPLGQLREELIQVKQSLEGAMNEVNNQLAVRRELRDRRRSLRSLSRVCDSIKKLKGLLVTQENETKSVQPLVLERATSEYIQLVVNSQRSARDLKDPDSKDCQLVNQLLMDACRQLFLESVNSGEERRHSLYQCLSFYNTLNRVDNVHQLYRKDVVSPVMRQLINRNTLAKMPGGLSALYGKILDFTDGEMKILIEVSQKFNSDVNEKKYDFLLESFWPEVEERIGTELQSLFASGDPDDFYQRYQNTLSFLESLISRSKIGRNSSHQLSKFDSFMDKWNLPVYFQLRFQEIVRRIEKAIASETVFSDGESWKLNVTDVVHGCLLRCWEDGVFLLPLAHKFWKLTLQIVSRYVTWIKKTLQNVDVKGKTDLNFFVALYSDVESMEKRLPEVRDLAAAKFVSTSDETINLLSQSLSETAAELKRLLDDISQTIVKGLSSELLSYLRQVNDIPRLFRRTDRDAPTKPCPYVVSLLEKPKLFFAEHRSHPKVLFWLQAMFSEVTKQYYSSVDDVLNSVKKTEECLRRLKKARDKSSNVTNTNDKRVGDDNKIRQQLVLDVRSYLEGIENFGLEKSSVDQLAELLLLVEASQ
ncbi:conserved oligomeric Golgi complex [Nesidiocoris tenuis]|uniref:Conserved oligomeric Golgi complex subunit 2 n=1 Tax=Nesidiocoris tenuis TaxID=355587 RepID=A0ABN7BC84_9HEMI|nr:conserved oligomeric Golgi complex [Nesidiocoris tenuis]